MIQTCPDCHKQFDDFDHFCYCPHAKFEPSADAKKALAERMDRLPHSAQYKDLPPPSGIEAMVCADIARRQQHGINKYGQTVADNPLSLREWLNHAYEEALDSCVYLRRAIDELDRVREYDKRIRSANIIRHYFQGEGNQCNQCGHFREHDIHV